MSGCNEFEKRYQALLKEHKREEKAHLKHMKKEIRKALLKSKIQKLLYRVK